MNTPALPMNPKHLFYLITGLLAAAFAFRASAQTSTNQPGEAEMMANMMALAQPGDAHKELSSMAGKWSYTVKWWMNPQSPPMESRGTTESKLIMGGRYLISNHKGKMEMPGAGGGMTNMVFEGMAIEGYDNVKKKYVSSWIDNMGTGIENSEGTYDAATKTLTYMGSYEAMPGMVTKMKQVTKCIDNDHHTMEMFEIQGGKEVKTMEISYSRK
jgi:hypothetical protein